MKNRINSNGKSFELEVFSALEKYNPINSKLKGSFYHIIKSIYSDEKKMVIHTRPITFISDDIKHPSDLYIFHYKGIDALCEIRTQEINGSALDKFGIIPAWFKNSLAKQKFVIVNDNFLKIITKNKYEYWKDHLSINSIQLISISDFKSWVKRMLK